MKKLLLIFCLATPCQGIEAPPKYLSTFGGLDVYHDSSKIADTDASALSNVLTDRVFLEKRTGSEQFQTLLDGWSVQYLQEFISPSKTRYLVAHASSTVYYSDTSAAFVKLATTTLTYNLDCTSAFGKIYCADGVMQPWYWDGTSTNVATGFPICTFLEFADERVYCANTDGNDSRVNTSAFGDPTDWTVPSDLSELPDAPNLFTFQRTDGEGITCFKSTPWGKFIGKKHSTHMLKGQDNDTYYKRIVDPAIGCVDDRSVQMVDGWLMWLSLEGVYAWGGSGPPLLISQDIDPEIKAARQLASNKANWVNSTQADWQAGKLDVSGAGALVSATYDPGSITVSSWTVTNNTCTGGFSSGTFTGTSCDNDSVIVDKLYANADFEQGNLDYWTVTPSTGFTVIPGGPTGSVYSVLLGVDFDRTGAKINAINSAGVIIKQDDCAFGAAWLTGDCTVDVSTLTVPFKIQMVGSGDYKITSDFYTSSNVVIIGLLGYHNTVSGRDQIDSYGYPTYSSFKSEIFDTYLSTPVGGPLAVVISTAQSGSIDFIVRSSSSPNDDMWSESVSYANGDKVVAPNRYWQFCSTFTAITSTYSAVLKSFTLLARTTAEYYSDVKYIGTGISSWLTFDANESADGGSLTYFTRSSDTVFAKDSVLPTWTAQGNHLQVAASTNTYYQWRSVFNVPSGSNTVTINDVTTNWQEGSEVPVASMVWDHRYHLCVINSSSTLINDRCWVYQRNKKWTHFDGPNYASLAIFNNEPIAGSANTDGKIFKIMRPGVYNDDGVAIDAYWNTGNYTFDSAMAQKKLNEIWIDAGYNSGGTLNVGYSLNKSSVFTSTDTALDTTTNYVAKRVEGLIGDYDTGRYIGFRFKNSTIDSGFNLNTVLIRADIYPLRSD